MAIQKTGGLPTLADYSVYEALGQSKVATLLAKSVTAIRHDIDATEIDHVFIEISTQKRSQESIFLVNINSPPSQRKANFGYLLRKEEQAAGKKGLVILEDFIAWHKSWGYIKEAKKGRDLAREVDRSRLSLITDHTQPTRIETPSIRKRLGQARLTDWVAYRKTRAYSEDADITDITSWVAGIKADCKRLTREVALTTSTPEKMETAEHNRKLRLKVVEVTRQAEEYATELSGRNFDQKCNELHGTLGWKKTWAFLRALIDTTMTKSENRKTTQRITHRFQGTDRGMLENIKQRYVGDTTDVKCNLAYTGNNILEAVEAAIAPHSPSPTRAKRPLQMDGKTLLFIEGAEKGNKGSGWVKGSWTPVILATFCAWSKRPLWASSYGWARRASHGSLL
ncbi:hypothetical protein HPB49_009307 [Dermacentor silvarum]|uniref:Uncharacterized protein n=1 Tax=Dermacentor silvarum TaxID=543639 RepID=A0ACB8CQV8_DERSI|nr:hypothetical protein HPB49_009307 [Dermacentor silvarum]